MIPAGTDLTPFTYDTITNVPPEMIANILQVTHEAYQAAIQTPGARNSGQSYDDIKNSASFCKSYERCS